MFYPNHGRPAKGIFGTKLLFYLSKHKNSDRLEHSKSPLAVDLLMEDIDDLQDELAALEREHRELDEEISRLVSTPPVDLLQIQRLKKKKLVLKDQIQKIRSNILPDIIA